MEKKGLSSVGLILIILILLFSFLLILIIFIFLLQSNQDSASDNENSSLTLEKPSNIFEDNQDVPEYDTGGLDIGGGGGGGGGSSRGSSSSITTTNLNEELPWGKRTVEKTFYSNENQVPGLPSLKFNFKEFFKRIRDLF